MNKDELVTKINQMNALIKGQETYLKDNYIPIPIKGYYEKIGRDWCIIIKGKPSDQTSVVNKVEYLESNRFATIENLLREANIAIEGRIDDQLHDLRSRIDQCLNESDTD